MRPSGVILCLLSLTFDAAAETDEKLFDANVLHEVRLYLHPGDWTRLKTTFRENTYYPAELVWAGQSVANVGIRSRGRGSRSATKPGLRVDFDRYEDGQRFLGLKSLVLDNLTQDPPMARERLAMLFFRRMGIAAPREAHARLYVNNVYAGLYAIVESVDKMFLSRNFGEDSGYLYEYRWPAPNDLGYPGPEPSLYCPVPFEPRTHEKDPKPAVLEAFVRAVNQSSDQDYARAVGEFIDWRQFLAYVAVENFLGESDGFVGTNGMNNFYLYRPAGKTQFTWIPWDKDASFIWEDHPLFFRMDTNVLTRRALRNPELLRIYLEALDRSAAAAEEDLWLETSAQRITDQIRRAALEDTNKRLGNEDFEEALVYFHFFVGQRSQRVREALAEWLGPR